MPITIKEIAELSGTSRGTVDRVLNGRGKVSEEKEKKILEIAEKYGYRVNRVARALVNSKKQYKIGVLVNSEDNDFYKRVLKGIKEIEKSNRNRQFEFIYYKNKHQDEKKQMENLNEVIKQGINGLIITPIVSKKIKKMLETIEIPIVMCVHDLNLDKDNSFFVGCNYKSNGRLAADIANILIDHGKILIVSGPSYINSYEKRNIGFVKHIKDKENEIALIYTKDTEESTYEEVVNKVESGFIPDLIYFNTYGIGGGLKAIKDLEIKPKVISVDETEAVIKGINNDEISITVTQQPEKQGVRAIEIMMNLLLVQQKPMTPHVIIGNKIKVKSSNFNEIVWKEN